VMSEKGLDISQQRSKSVREYMGQMHFDYLVTVCAHAEKNCPTTFLGFGTKLYWEFEDPAAFTGSRQETLAKFRTVRDQIDSRIQDWLAESES
ncbi:MAG TPA: arsenate reductase ArsC, partial [Aggregatilineaceae bacterium]|nr:arsenate reductase ArsC [Aggregatilineaceae bacterium]